MRELRPARRLPRWLAFLIATVVAFGTAVTAVPSASAFPGDNYPEPWRSAPINSYVDSWGYYSRNCTSWAAWALHDRNGFEMPRAIGNAANWGHWASSHGYPVNSSPAVGSIAWWDDGGFGHVAWVESVNGDQVTIQEYNYGFTGSYHSRTINKTSPTGYIHFKDMSAPPQNPTGNVKSISVSPQGSEEHIFTVDGTNTIRETYLVEGQSPQTVEIYRFSGHTARDVASLIVDSKRFVYVATAEGEIYEFSWMPGDTPARRVIANISGVRDISVSPQGSERHIFTVDTSNALRETYLVNGQSPQTVEIYRFSGNTPANVASYIGSDNKRFVYMPTAEGRLYEFSWMAGDAPAKRVIANISGVRDVSVSPQGSEKHIFTVDTSRAIRETYLVNGQSPQTAEIYRFSGNTPTGVASLIMSNTRRYVYMSTAENRMWEFSWMPGGTLSKKNIATF